MGRGRSGLVVRKSFGLVVRNEDAMALFGHFGLDEEGILPIKVRVRALVRARVRARARARVLVHRFYGGCLRAMSLEQRYTVSPPSGSAVRPGRGAYI